METVKHLRRAQILTIGIKKRCRKESREYVMAYGETDSEAVKNLKALLNKMEKGYRTFDVEKKFIIYAVTIRERDGYRVTEHDGMPHITDKTCIFGRVEGDSLVF